MTRESTPSENRRQHERFALARQTRFVSRLDLEACGRLLDISEGGMALAAESAAAIGDEIIAYPEGLGRLPGVVVRKFDGGLGVRFTLSDGQRANLAKRIRSAVTRMPYLRLVENRASSPMALALPAGGVIVRGRQSWAEKASNGLSGIGRLQGGGPVGGGARRSAATSRSARFRAASAAIRRTASPSTSTSASAAKS